MEVFARVFGLVQIGRKTPIKVRLCLEEVGVCPLSANSRPVRLKLIPFSNDLTFECCLFIPPTVDRYAENRKHEALSRSTVAFASRSPYCRLAIPAAMPASTAFRADVASVSLNGLGK